MCIPKQSQDFCLVAGSTDGELEFGFKKNKQTKKSIGGVLKKKKRGFCDLEGRLNKHDIYIMYLYTP